MREISLSPHHQRLSTPPMLILQLSYASDVTGRVKRSGFSEINDSEFITKVTMANITWRSVTIIFVNEMTN